MLSKKTHIRILSLLCAAALALGGCAGEGGAGTSSEAPAFGPAEPEQKTETSVDDTEPLVAGTISRYPENGTRFTSGWQDSRGLEEILTPDELGNLELRCADLTGADLSGLGEQLLFASFDDQTKWPEKLPVEFDRERLVELGKNPGLGVRALHERGITGKGVGIAIIDQTLLAEHREYAGRLRLYREYNTAAEDPAQMHGAAVASIALGETVGVAPDALLYYIADDVIRGTEENYVRDMSFYARDIDRLIALNGTLPEDEKIRIISMSVGYTQDTDGAAEMDAAVARAREAGIAVMMINSRDPLMGTFTGMGREPFGDPDSVDSRRPGQYMEEFIYSGEYTGAECVLVPMDRRATAAQTGPADYAYYPNGGSSWMAPYVAGLYALACQVKPDVTFAEFADAALATAQPVSFTHEGREYPYGKVADPAALLERLENAA